MSASEHGMSTGQSEPNADLIGYEFDNVAEGTRWRVKGTWMMDSYVELECIAGEPDETHSSTRIIGAAVARNRKAIGD